MLWWRARTAGNRFESAPAEPDHRENKLFEQLIQAARKGSASTPALLVQWANQRFAGQNFKTASEVLAGLNNATLSAELRRLQARLFAPGADTAENWDGRAWRKRCNRCVSSASRKSPWVPSCRHCIPTACRRRCGEAGSDYPGLLFNKTLSRDFPLLSELLVDHQLDRLALLFTNRGRHFQASLPVSGLGDGVA